MPEASCGTLPFGAYLFTGGAPSSTRAPFVARVRAPRGGGLGVGQGGRHAVGGCVRHVHRVHRARTEVAAVTLGFSIRRFASRTFLYKRFPEALDGLNEALPNSRSPRTERRPKPRVGSSRCPSRAPHSRPVEKGRTRSIAPFRCPATGARPTVE